MALISDILRGPYGDPQPNVIITMRAKETSARVLVSNSSAAITAADGKYSMQVFPGEYEVLVSTLGKVGEIRVYPDSKDGTLNDFLITPGEDELTPAIVQTVETMRVEAAKSAAAAKVSEDNSERNVLPVTSAGFGVGPRSADDIFSPNNISSIGRFTGSTTNAPSTVLGSFVSLPMDGGPTCGYIGLTLNRGLYVGRSNSTSNKTIEWKKVFTEEYGPKVTDISNLKDWGLTGGVTNGQINYNEARESRRGMVGAGGGAPGPVGSTNFLDVYGWKTDNGTTPASWRTLQNCYHYGVSGSEAGNVSLRIWQGSSWTQWYAYWTTRNTTVDSNGFIKKASPIVKLFRDGACELNDESQGVTTERVSEGVYRVSGTLGFNADAQWGGPDGGIEVPLDRNKQPLIWVDYEVEPNGDLLIKTYHRTHPAAPAFARNDVLGYDEGMPIDIPEGRWVDLRVEMPAVDQPDSEVEEEFTE
ncbi:prophage tail fiber N-terminal domain-containing protein [Serratia marcescens]|uniref:phage tail fiber protein n=1 Tax=Serratia marcescens TaxID=615 RepID=UPI003ED9B78F